MRTLLVISFIVFSNLVFAQTDSINKRIKNKINHFSDNPVHSILLYIENENNNFIYNDGFGKIDKDKEHVTTRSAFKIASSTKLFVSTVILQLQEEGKLNINDKVFPYLKGLEYLNYENVHILNGVKYGKNITIKQLLSHRSGLSDIFTDREEAFFEMINQTPNRQYSPKSIIELYYQYKLNNEPQFKPGEGWHYSDINYVLLGLIIEQLDNTKLAQSIRYRILEPLEMKDTFFEFYETQKTQTKQINQYVGNINFSKVNTSFDWAGGGLVSTNSDLATFIKALFKLKLINKVSLHEMIDVKFTKKNEIRYGLGIYEFVVNNDTFYGHFGFYGTFIGYSPETKTTLSYSISQVKPNFNPYGFVSQIIKTVN
jgi:D-alanyl-D-alanine carboxypeptidase